MHNLLIPVGIMSIMVYIVTTVMIYKNLKARGDKVSFLLLRLFAISYANRYKKLTKHETGKIGILFYLWIITINAALICAILILSVFKA